MALASCEVQKEFVGGLKDELVKITVQYKAGTVTANMFSEVLKNSGYNK